jgi:hypothetical protein
MQSSATGTSVTQQGDVLTITGTNFGAFVEDNRCDFGLFLFLLLLLLLLPLMMMMMMMMMMMLMAGVIVATAAVAMRRVWLSEKFECEMRSAMSTQLECTVPHLSRGSHTVSVLVVDGGRGYATIDAAIAPLSYSMQVLTASPVQGSGCGGSSVSIVGTGFFPDTAANTVLLEGDGLRYCAGHCSGHRHRHHQSRRCCVRVCACSLPCAVTSATVTTLTCVTPRHDSVCNGTTR